MLIGGVVLLTLKKPDPVTANAAAVSGTPSRTRAKASDEEQGDERDMEALHASVPGEREDVVWQIGEADDSDDEQPGGTSSLRPELTRKRSGSGSIRARASSWTSPKQLPKHQGEEGRGLMGAHHEDSEEDSDGDARWQSASVTGSPKARR